MVEFDVMAFPYLTDAAGGTAEPVIVSAQYQDCFILALVDFDDSFSFGHKGDIAFSSNMGQLILRQIVQIGHVHKIDVKNMVFICFKTNLVVIGLSYWNLCGEIKND